MYNYYRVRFGNHCCFAQFNGAQVHDNEHRRWKERWSPSFTGKDPNPRSNNKSNKQTNKKV